MDVKDLDTLMMYLQAESIGFDGYAEQVEDEGFKKALYYVSGRLEQILHELRMGYHDED